MRVVARRATIQTMTQTLQPIAVEPKPPAPEPSSRPRWWVRLLVVLVVVVAAGGAVVWWLAKPPTPVSVTDALARFRTAQPAAAVHLGGPASGVYVYATDGWEHISSANLTHHYPARTTVTVVDTACGLQIRWDALAGRSVRWDLCRTPNGWQLQHYVDAHKFLYVQDIHEYTCSGYPAVVCTTATGVLTNTVEQAGARHVRITQHATGRSVSDGVIDAWLLPSGLPERVVITDHGSQNTLGARIDYTESATFTLTSPTPLR